MKKLILAGAIALFGFSNAQIAKGNIYLTGQISYSKKENKNIGAKIENLKVIPTAGFFIGSGLSIGTGIGYTNSKSNKFEVIFSDPNLLFVTSRKNTSAVVVNPFVRKYWVLSGNLYFFGQLEIPMEFGETETYEYVSNTPNAITGTYTVNPANGIKTNYTSIGVNVKPGFDYFLNKNWSVEATVGEFGYNTYKEDIDGAKSINNYKFGLNLSSVTFGVKYVFAK